MICLAVRYRMKPGREQQALETLVALARESRREPGCRQYVVHTNPADRQEIYLYEQYDSDAAVAHHRASEHFRKYAEVALAPLFDSRELTVYHAV